MLKQGAYELELDGAAAVHHAEHVLQAAVRLSRDARMLDAVVCGGSMGAQHVKTVCGNRM